MANPFNDALQNLGQPTGNATPFAERLRNDPLFIEMLQMQGIIRQHEEGRVPDTFSRTYRNPQGLTQPQAAAVTIRNNAIELARRYEVDVESVFNVARGDSLSIAPDRQSDTFAQRMANAANRTKEAAMSLSDTVGEVTQPYRNFSANALGAIAGVLDPVIYVGGAFRTGRAEFLGDQQEIVDEHPSWLPTFAQQTVDAFEATGRTARNLGLVGEDAFTPDSGWITFFPTLRWGEHQIGRSPYEDERLTSGEELINLEGYDRTLVPLVERLGVSNEHAREIVGAGLEIAYDPLLAADFMFLGAGAARRAARLPGLGALSEAADQAENAGRVMLQTQAPINLIQPAAERISRVARRLLDSPVPGVPGIRGEAVEAFGLTGSGRRVNRLTLGDFFFQEGVAPFDEDLHWLTGGSPFGAFSSESGQIGLLNEARALQRTIQRTALRGISDSLRPFAEQFATTVPRKYKNNRIVMPQSIEYPESARAALGVYNENVWQFLDDVGVVYSPEELAPYLGRVKKLAEVNGLDPTKMGIAFRQSVANARKSILETGHLASRYDEFVGFIERAAADIGMNPGVARQLYERAYAGVDITGVLSREVAEGTPEASVLESFLRGVPEEGVEAAELTAGQREVVAQLDERVRGMMREAGFNPTLDPLTFLKGVREGYVRRVIGSRAAPEETMQSLLSDALTVVQPARVQDLPGRVAEVWNERAADAVRAYLETRPPGIGVFRTEELAGVIQRATGQEVNMKDLIGRVLYPDDASRQFLHETIEMINPPRSGGGPGEFQATAGMDARQSLSEGALTRLNQMRDVPTSLAEMGRAAGQNVKARHVLDGSFRELSERGLILSGDELKKTLLQDAVSGVNYRTAIEGNQLVPFKTPNGGQWVLVPKNQKAWGALAGNAIPAYAASKILRVMQSPTSTRGNAALNLWGSFKGTLLSPFSTSLTNIVSGLHIISTAGLDLGSLLRNASRGFKAREEFLQTGRISDLPGIERYINFMDDGTMTSTARETMSELLEGFGKHADAPDGVVGYIADVANRTASLMDRVADMPPIGFLSLFRTGEESTRLAAVYAMMERLTRRGVPYEEALKRAAHFGNNAAHDYGSAAAIPTAMSRYGFSAFPQFAWFQTSRAARVLAERPNIPVRIDRYRNLANVALNPEDDEREALNAVMEDWVKMSRPLVINLPFGPDKGTKYAVPLDRWLGAATGQFDTLAMSPLSGGALRAITEALIAPSMNGEAFLSGRYGRQVYDPAAGFAERLLQTAGFVAGSYSPPQLRLASDLLESVTYEGDRELREILFGYPQNNEAGQVLMRLLGFSTRKVDTSVMGTSHRAKIRSIEREYEPRLASVRRSIQQAVLDNDTERMNQLIDKLIGLETRFVEDQMRLLNAVD